MFKMPELDEFDSGKDMNRKWTKALEGKVVVDAEKLIYGNINNMVHDSVELYNSDAEKITLSIIAYLTQGEDT